MAFQFCLNTSTIKPQPLLKKIELAANAGFAGIELWINDVYDFIGRGGEVADVEKALADHGLFVPSVIAIRQWGDMDGWEYQLVLDEARRRFALGARLGAKYIVATPPLEQEGQDHLPSRYKDLLNIGREEGILPTFEYMNRYLPSRNFHNLHLKHYQHHLNKLSKCLSLLYYHFPSNRGHFYQLCKLFLFQSR